jgi:hypothetical protein
MFEGYETLIQALDNLYNHLAVEDGLILYGIDEKAASLITPNY